MFFNDTTSPFVPLYRQRTFGDKFSDTLTFLRGQWRPLLTLMVYFILPLCMVLSVLLPDVVNIDSQSEGPDTTSFLCMVLGSLLGTTMLSAIVFALLRQYFYAPEKLQAPTLRSLWPDVRYCLWRGVLLMLMLCAVGLLGVGLYFTLSAILVSDPALLIIFIIFSFPAIFCLLLPLGLSAARTMLTDEGVLHSMLAGYRLGYKTMIGVAAIVMTFSLLGSCISGLCSLPMTVCFIAKAIAFGSNETSFVETPLFALIQYLSGVLYFFTQFACSSLALVALAFQYGHAADKLEGVGATYDIANFENL